MQSFRLAQKDFHSNSLGGVAKTKGFGLKMSQMAYHQEAQRRQRVIERKQLALERLKLQQFARLVSRSKPILIFCAMRIACFF